MLPTPAGSSDEDPIADALGKRKAGGPLNSAFHSSFSAAAVGLIPPLPHPL